MKKLILVLILALIPGLSFAGSHSVGVTMAKVQASYSDILFYHNADSWATAPTKGAGTVAFTEWASQNTSTTTKLAGTGSFDTNDDGYGKMIIPVASNFSTANARIGFWVHLKEASEATHRIVALTNSTGVNETSGSLFIYILSGGGIRASINGTQFNATTTAANGTAYYVELSIHNNTDVDLLVNGVSEASGTCANTTHNGTHLTFFSDTTMLNAYYDQIVFSNDYTRNIYAIRTVTDFN